MHRDDGTLDDALVEVSVVQHKYGATRPGPGGVCCFDTPASKMRARPRAAKYPAYVGPVFGPAFTWRNRRAFFWFRFCGSNSGCPTQLFWRFAAKRDSQPPRGVRRISRRPWRARRPLEFNLHTYHRVGMDLAS